MKTSNYPKMTQLKTGNLYKVLEVTGISGMNMPEHISTKEAVIIVQKGTAILKMIGNEHVLKLNKSLIIPAGEKHALQITEDFQAVVIMECDSEIKFINN
ncbi:MAG TPA: cupin domain-containing protein [Bacteroidia bacterium]|nr:cupin domain-containing protein [Bacteroidia bacterium]